MPFELVNATNQPALIKVIGVGGGGGNAVMHMLQTKIEGVEFICANTDAQALKESGVEPVLQLGSSITKGLGAGSDPDVGRQAALEDRDSTYRCSSCKRNGHPDCGSCYSSFQIRRKETFKYS